MMHDVFYIQNLNGDKWTIPRSDGLLEQWNLASYLYIEGNSQDLLKVSIFKEVGFVQTFRAKPGHEEVSDHEAI